MFLQALMSPSSRGLQHVSAFMAEGYTAHACSCVMLGQWSGLCHVFDFAIADLKGNMASALIMRIWEGKLQVEISRSAEKNWLKMHFPQRRGAWNVRF